MTTVKTIPIHNSTPQKQKKKTDPRPRRAAAAKPASETDAERIERLLENYKEISRRRVGDKIQVMDSIRYSVDNELRYGGVVVHKEPDHLVLKNFAKQFTWKVDLTQPNLRIFWKKRVTKSTMRPTS